MRLTITNINTKLFFLLSILLVLFVYFLIVFSAGDVQDAANVQNNVFVHIFRLAILGTVSILVLVNRFRFKKCELLILVLIWCTWMFLCNLVNLERYVVNLTYVLLWPAFFLAFYFFSEKLSNYNFPRYLYSCLFIFISILYVFVAREKNVALEEERLASVGHIYYVILLLPWIFMIENRKILNLFLLIVIALTIYSAKRGAILIALLSVAVYVYTAYIKGGKRGINIRGFLLGVIFVGIGIYILSWINESSGGYILQRFENVEKDQGSGRLGLWENVIELFRKTPFEYKIFGHSHNTVQLTTDMGLSAHNDFLEALYDYGIVGFILLLLIFLTLLKRVLILYRRQSDYFIPYAVSLIIFVFMTSVSHIILYPTYIVFLASFLGYMETTISREVK